MLKNLLWPDKYGSESVYDGVLIHAFTIFHLVAFLIGLTLIVSYVYFYRRGDEKRRGNMRKGLALAIILSELMKLSIMALDGGHVANNLPFEICSAAEYALLIDALWPGHDRLRQLLMLAFFPAAAVALIFPSITVFPPAAFFFLRFILLHAGIVAYAAALYAAGEIRLKYSGIWTSLLICAAMALGVYLLDLRFGRNFMFLTYHEENPAFKILWSISGGGLAYVGCTILLVCVVMHLNYFLLKLPERRRS